jgi:hypothetical protein
MVVAETMAGINGHKVYAIPHRHLMDVMKKYNRSTNCRAPEEEGCCKMRRPLKKFFVSLERGRRQACLCILSARSLAKRSKDVIGYINVDFVLYSDDQVLCITNSADTILDMFAYRRERL